MPTGVYEHRETPLRVRISRRVAVDPVTGCWNWTARLGKNGYGMLSMGRRSRGEKRTAYAHRVSYETHVGTIPLGREIDHRCRNRRCVNPAHLEPVTRAENTRRGVGPAMLGALNGTKTHCKNGHAFTADNTRHRPTGGRTCRQCERDGKERRRR